MSSRAGAWVEVRSKEEILATLDAQGRLENMPFMPEMFAFCGQRLQVSARAHKTCDTLSWTGNRSLENAVHLEGTRCNGAAHAGCQAACLLFWKEAWLKPADGPAEFYLHKLAEFRIAPPPEGWQGQVDLSEK